MTQSWVRTRKELFSLNGPSWTPQHMTLSNLFLRQIVAGVHSFILPEDAIMDGISLRLQKEILRIGSWKNLLSIKLE